MQNEAPSLLAYFIANAPKEIPSWFAPSGLGPRPVIRYKVGDLETESLPEAAKALAEQNRISHEVAEFRAKQCAVNNAELYDWSLRLQSEATLQWPVFWAREMVRRLEGGAQ